MSLELWQEAAVALAIGLLVGAERERSKGAAGTAGIRTFALVALLGYLAGLLDPLPAAVLGAAVAVFVATAYVSARTQDPGLTTEVALLVTWALGYLTHTEAALAVGAGVAMAVLLVSKETLHHFVRDTVSEVELVDALKFFVVAFIVLPLLPTGEVGPYGVLVPQRVWLLVVLITGIGWVGHVATRALGARRGLLLTGLAGGFVSGTATIGAMGARVRRDEAPRDTALAGALMASVATLVQIAVLTSIADAEVGRRLYAPVAAGIAVLLVEAWVLSRRSPATSTATEAGRPFALLPALVLAAVISGVLVLAAWMNDRYGASGAVLAAGIGSLADTHASAVAVASLAHEGKVAVDVAVQGVAIGLLTNTGSKTVAALATGGGRFGLAVLVWHVPVAAAFAAAVLVPTG